MAILAGAGVLALFFGMWRIQYNIQSPFKLKPLELPNTTQLDFHTQDTDGDGWSDFDETYLYKTSPYLEDTDSDGISDGAEIKNGTDPNCPEGKACGIEPVLNQQVGVSAPAALNAATNNAPIVTANPLLDEKGQMKTNPAPADIRQLLLDAGMKADDLKKLDDVTLIQLYQEVLKQGATGQQGASNP